jgi:hypothetical protein
MHRGYIKLWRKTMDSYLFTNSRALHLWVHILLEANHSSKEFMFNGLKHICDRGQFITGRKQLSLSTGISESHIEFLLNAFEKEDLIRQQKTNKNRLITVLKYEEYQGENRQQIDNKKTTNRQQIDTTNNVITNKNKEKQIDISRKHSLENSPYFPFENFKDAIKKSPASNWWCDEKIKDYYNRALGYSKANGGKYMDWLQAVQNWERKDNGTGKNGFSNSFRKGDNTAGTADNDKYSKAGIPD